jgi:hypothetical protein
VLIPNAGTWDIKKFVKMTVSVFDRTVVNNNTTQTLKTTVETTLSNYVVNNIFTITHDNIKTLLFDTPIVPFNKTPIKPDEVVSIQFVITADAVDKVKYPQPTIQSFNFVYNKPVTDSPLSPAALLASVLNNSTRVFRLKWGKLLVVDYLTIMELHIIILKSLRVDTLHSGLYVQTY